MSTKKKMMRNKVKIGGLMCRSPASMAVCMPVPDDVRSVMVPRRGASTIRRDNFLGFNDKYHNVKYSRLNIDTEKLLVANKFDNSDTSNTSTRREVNYLAFSKRNRDHVHHQYQQKPRVLQLSSSANSDNVFQVVVLRVSLHCQGCAGKVKKHLSRMEGVTSFSIDLETKRVTVMGHVSPAGVLESVSKIKRAEFWSH